ncbi:NAD-dependent epimerase/dehydratase family protein [Staphylococcus warneri]|uniref:NAD-dependent epimerase/dehydratase family protein n=1 Tax=Staphylococcus warneri TaxID=1292 RepID=UPI00326027AC
MRERVLITGKNGYIGNQLERYLVNFGYQVERLDMKSLNWKNYDFTEFKVVIHLAALVHNNMPHASMLDYMNINYHKSLDLVEKAKAEGVQQFIFFSTMSVYGEEGKLNKSVEISKDTPCRPETMYGKSKWLAEEKIKTFANENFIVNIVRPPMIYGKNAPGNFLKLIKVAQLMPIFPKINNKRSVLYIDGLCEHIKYLMHLRRNTITHPQNQTYMQTNQALWHIREAFGKKVKIIEMPIPTFVLNHLSQIRVINKIYGNLTYAMDIDGNLGEKQTKPFKQTIRETVN